MADWKLYYDGECNLCHGSQLTVVRWAAKSGQKVHTEILQSAEAVAKGYVSDEMVLEADGVFRGHNAWIRLMKTAPWYLSWIGWVGRLPVLNQILAMGYAIVAKFRKRWFGTRECPLPPRP